jgi:hypothetical protein
MENMKTKWIEIQEEQGLDPNRHHSTWHEYSECPAINAYEVILSDPGDENEHIRSKKQM